MTTADGDSTAGNSTCPCSIFARLANERQELGADEGSRGLGAVPVYDDDGIENMTTALMGRCRLSLLTISRLASSMHQSSLKYDFGFDAPIRFKEKRSFCFKFGVPPRGKHDFGFDPKLPLPPKGTKGCEETDDIAGAGASTLSNRTLNRTEPS